MRWVLVFMFVCILLYRIYHCFGQCSMFRWWVGWQDMLKRDGELGWIRLQLMLEEEEEQEE